MGHDREPLTPMGRLCLRPEHNHVIHCVIGLENPVDIDALKHQISNFIILKVPRFSSLLVLDPFEGAETWRETQVNIDDHVFIHQKLHNYGDDDNDNGHHTHKSSKDDMINSFLSELAISQPMRLDKPLWEIHILQDQNCLVMKVHHALGDGVSIMSMLWSMGRSRTRGGVMDVDDQVQEFEKQLNANYSAKKSSKRMGLWGFLMFIWYSLVFGLKFLLKCLLVNDKVKVISGIDGVELWPRKIATARFRLADMKAIKKAVPNATVNDVLYGIVWCGLTRYLNARYPQAAQNGVEFNGICPVNLREQSGLQDILSSTVSWGNKFSLILLPMNHYNKQSELEPLQYVARAKSVMDKKKQSMEARLSYNSIKYASKFFGPKMGGFMYYKFFNHTSFLLSNIPGPREKITIANNPVAFIRVTSSTTPHAITMHMVSYLEWADLQIQVAKDLITDPKFLAKCFEDILQEMKNATNDDVAN